jgi:3',5'-cyclic-AMP phosphodiesterase
VVNLTADDHERALGRRPGHTVHDLGAARLLLWEPPVDFHRPRGFDPAGEHLTWLVDALSADPRPAIIASHIPLSGAAMTGNYYFANNPSLATYPDNAGIRAAVEGTGAAALWLSGHVHWNSFDIVGNIRHATLQSPSETFTTNRQPALSWGILEIAGETATLEISGRDPLTVSFPFARSDTCPWPAPRPAIA